MIRVHKKLLMRDVWGDPSNNGTDSSSSCVQCVYNRKAHPSVSEQTNEFLIYNMLKVRLFSKIV